VHLSSADTIDLIECLDYSRMSITPRRETKSRSASRLTTLSQLPSPLCKESVNLLPLTYTHPLQSYPSSEEMFDSSGVFDSTSKFLHTSASMPMYNSIPLRPHMSDPSELSNSRAGISISSMISSSLPPQSN
jgi:hypothetical protein